MPKFTEVYPFADQAVGLDRLVIGQFPAGAPVGIVVHHAADRDPERVRRSLEGKGLGYHVTIARDGSVTQQAWLDHYVYHAGKAIWRGHSPNQKFLAVCILSWGELKLVRGLPTAWNGDPVPVEEAAWRRSNLTKDQYLWDAATENQIGSLKRFCIWAIGQGIPIDNICGHDECAIPPGRKSDPGGVLPFTMEEFRRQLILETAKMAAVV